MSLNTDNIEQWASSRETDTRVAEAIFWLAVDAADADRIWQDPSREEWTAVWERSTENGLRDGCDMQWGESAMGNEYPS